MPPLIKHAMQILVLDNSEGEQCDVHCGVDWSSAETITLAKQRIKDGYGDKIQLEYLDLAEPVTNHRVPELNRLINDKHLPLPLLVIDGQPRISGQFDIRQLLDAISAEIEIKQLP